MLLVSGGVVLVVAEHHGLKVRPDEFSEQKERHVCSGLFFHFLRLLVVGREGVVVDVVFGRPYDHLGVDLEHEQRDLRDDGKIPVEVLA